MSNTHASLLREYLELVSALDVPERALGYRDWLRRRVGGAAVAVGVALTLTACGGATGSDDGGRGGAPEDESGLAGDANSAAGAENGGSLGEGGDVVASGGGGTLYGIVMGGRTGSGGATGSGGGVLYGIAGMMPSAGGTGSGGAAGFGGGGTRYAIPIEDCTNGVDDDGDGQVDCADPSCSPQCGSGGGVIYGIAGMFPGFGGATGGGGVTSTGGMGTGGTLYGIPMENCTNGVDDNYNGDIDCDDVMDCEFHSACRGAGGSGRGRCRGRGRLRGRLWGPDGSGDL